MSVSERAAACATSTAAAAADGANRKLGRQASFFTKEREGLGAALFNLVAKSRRRYGGYIVHVGIAIMFFGFIGRAWETSKEVSLEPGQTVDIEEYVLTYKGPRMEVDHEKRMLFTDIDVQRHGEFVGTIAPARYIYKASPQQPSTEIDRFVTLRNDLYVSLGSANPQSKVASFRVHINPLVSFVWFGFGVLFVGAMVAMWPETSQQEAGAFSYVRALGSVASMVMLSATLALTAVATQTACPTTPWWRRSRISSNAQTSHLSF